MNRLLKLLGAVFIGIVVLVAVAAAILIPKAMRLNEDAVAWIERNVPPLVADWNPDALRQRAAPELLQQPGIEQLPDVFVWFSSLGRLISLDVPLGNIGRGPYPGSTFDGTWAEHVASARFEAGDAQIKIVLRRHGDSWQVMGFHITSAALLPRPTDPPATPPNPHGSGQTPPDDAPAPPPGES